MLTLDGLSRRFGEVIALDGLSFAVQPGQMHGFVGGNGAGKTTAMRIVMGLARADSGEVRWHDKAVTQQQRRRFGYMPEERGLYPRMRVGEQLAYFAQLHGMAAAEARTAAGHWLERFGLADRRQDPLEKLSLGNQQRIQLAAALVHNPDFLLLDEPFSGLDPVGVDDVSSALQEYAARGAPVLFSSHQLELVERLCDSVAIIDAGRLVASGRVENLAREGRERLRGVRVSVRTTDPAATAESMLRGVPAISVLSQARSTEALDVQVRVDDAADIDATSRAVLDAARAAGDVVFFGRKEPRLSELYREVVGR